MSSAAEASGRPVRGGIAGLGGTRETLIVSCIFAAALAIPAALANTSDGYPAS